MCLVSSCHRAHTPWPHGRSLSRGQPDKRQSGTEIGLGWQRYVLGPPPLSPQRQAPDNIRKGPLAWPHPASIGLKTGVDKAVNDLADLAKPHSSCEGVEAKQTGWIQWPDTRNSAGSGHFSNKHRAFRTNTTKRNRGIPAESREQTPVLRAQPEEKGKRGEENLKSLSISSRDWVQLQTPRVELARSSLSPSLRDLNVLLVC